MSFSLLDRCRCRAIPPSPTRMFFAHGENAALVMDGATPLGDGLMPGPSDAAWIAQFGARRLMAHLKEGDGARKALRACAGRCGKKF